MSYVLGNLVNFDIGVGFNFIIVFFVVIEFVVEFEIGFVIIFFFFLEVSCFGKLFFLR